MIPRVPICFIRLLLLLNLIFLQLMSVRTRRRELVVTLRPCTRREIQLPTPTTHVKGGGLCCAAGLEFCFFVVFTLTHLLKFSFYDDDDLGLIRTVQFQQDGLYRHDGCCYCVAADLALDTALDAAFRPGDCLSVELRLSC